MPSLDAFAVADAVLFAGHDRSRLSVLSYNAIAMMGIKADWTPPAAEPRGHREPRLHIGRNRSANTSPMSSPRGEEDQSRPWARNNSPRTAVSATSRTSPRRSLGSEVDVASSKEVRRPCFYQGVAVHGVVGTIKPRS